MYENLALIAGFTFAYAAIAGRVERSALSGPILFVTFGLIAGPAGLGILTLTVEAEGLKELAELTLAVVLFADAANANLSVLKRVAALPARLLLLGLPLTILLGVGAALLLFPEMSLLEAGILGTMLAPTDAALGKAVVTNESVPTEIREGLNFESGLNDGICVPILFVLLAMATGQSDERPGALALTLFAEELGIGIAVGLGLALLGAALLRKTVVLGWVGENWLGAVVAALGLTCFGLAQAMGGSGFIAAFFGGLVFGSFITKRKHELVGAAELVGDLLSLATWVCFGAVVVPAAFGVVDLRVALLAVLSLTAIRMLPVFVSLLGTGARSRAKLFIGWFGPRGLASVVFCVIVLGESLPHAATIAAVVAWTVILSVVGHGVSANPLATRFAKSLDPPT